LNFVTAWIILERAEGWTVHPADGSGVLNLHLGTSGWSYPGWRGRFYPAGLPSGGWLPFYAGSFNTVEINMSFYRLPKPEVLRRWSDLTPAGFLFTLKANRQITHIKKLRNVGHEVSFFYHLARNLGDKLGCILYQLPPVIARDDSLLREFLSVLSPEYRNVIEFRDPSWYAEDVYALLRTSRATFCIVSSAKVPADAVMTSDTAYFRFHGLTGGYRHDYSEPELREWAGLIRATGATETFAYFNNDYQAQAVGNARRLRELLSAPPGS
jgi:uncharacterized protein YecE (DUF72 family)